MRIIFRTDASHSIGTGHVIRCLALALELKNAGHEVQFFSLPEPGNLNEQIKSEGFTVLSSPAGNYDLCIFDHYALQAKEEHEFRKFSKKIIVIDDWTDHQHDADLMLDPSISTRSALRKRNNPRSKFLGGAPWLLLRKDFAEAKKSTHPRTQFKNVLLFFGGSDPQDQVIEYFRELQSRKTQLHYHFMVANTHPRADEFRKLTLPLHISFHFSPASVGKLMSEMDVYLGSSGTITWERMCLGLTGLVVSIIENQEDNAKTAHEMGFHRYLGRHTEVKPAQAIDELETWVKAPATLIEMSRKCFEEVDGLATSRFVRDILPDLVS